MSDICRYFSPYLDLYPVGATCGSYYRLGNYFSLSNLLLKSSRLSSSSLSSFLYLCLSEVRSMVDFRPSFLSIRYFIMSAWNLWSTFMSLDFINSNVFNVIIRSIKLYISCCTRNSISFSDIVSENVRE